LDLLADVVDARVVRLVDLRPSGNSRFDSVTLLIFRDVSPKLGDDRRPLGTRAHDVHVAAQHVPELRHFVEARAAQEPTAGRATGLGRRAPGRSPLGRRVPVDRGDLERREPPSAMIVETPVAIARITPATVDTYACLRIEHWAARRELDRDRDQRDERGEN